MTDNIQVTFAADGLLTGKMVLAHGTHQTDGYQYFLKDCGRAPPKNLHESVSMRGSQADPLDSRLQAPLGSARLKGPGGAGA